MSTHLEPGRGLPLFKRHLPLAPFTQGSLMRFLISERSDVETAKAVLASFTHLPGHIFWPDESGYALVEMRGVLGHRQVTDANLAQLARDNRGKLVPFDENLAALHTDVSELLG